MPDVQCLPCLEIAEDRILTTQDCYGG